MFTVRPVREFVRSEHTALSNIAGERWIGHQYVEREAPIISRVLLSQASQPREAGAVGVVPIVLLCGLVPLGLVEAVEMQDVGLAVAGNKVQAASDSYTLFVEADRIDLLAHVIDAAARFFLHGERCDSGKPRSRRILLQT
jgi:hypothetical protein